MVRTHKPETIEKEERLAIALAGLENEQWDTVYEAAKDIEVLVTHSGNDGGEENHVQKPEKNSNA